MCLGGKKGKGERGKVTCVSVCLGGKKGKGERGRGHLRFSVFGGGEGEGERGRGHLRSRANLRSRSLTSWRSATRLLSNSSATVFLRGSICMVNMVNMVKKR